MDDGLVSTEVHSWLLLVSLKESTEPFSRQGLEGSTLAIHGRHLFLNPLRLFLSAQYFKLLLLLSAADLVFLCSIFFCKWQSSYGQSSLKVRASVFVNTGLCPEPNGLSFGVSSVGQTLCFLQEAWRKKTSVMVSTSQNVQISNSLLLL